MNLAVQNYQVKSNFNQTCQNNNIAQTNVAQNQSPNFRGAESATICKARKAITLPNLRHLPRRCLIALGTSVFYLRNKNSINSINELFEGINRQSTEYINALVALGCSIGEGLEIALNDSKSRQSNKGNQPEKTADTDNEIPETIKEIAQSGKPHIFITEHNNKYTTPLLGCFITFLNEEYINNEHTKTCPKPRIIIEKTYLESAHPAIKKLLENIGAIGIDADMTDKTVLNQVKKEYIDGESNIYIFTNSHKRDGKSFISNENFLPGIVDIIKDLTSETDVNVVPIETAANSYEDMAIEISKPMIFEKGSRAVGSHILDLIKEAMEDANKLAKSEVSEPLPSLLKFVNSILPILDTSNPKGAKIYTLERKVEKFEDKVTSSNSIDRSEGFDPTQYEKFSDIPGERSGNYIYQKNLDGTVVREFCLLDQKRLHLLMTEYDPKTGKKMKETTFREDGKTIEYISEYDFETGKKTKETNFREDGETIVFISEYDPETGNETKRIKFQEDGKTIEYISEYDPKTRNITKDTYFQDDGKTIKSIFEYDPKTRNKTKRTYSREDGKTIDHIEEYDPKTGNIIKATTFRKDGKTIRYIAEGDPITGKITKGTYFREDGKTIEHIEEY